MSGVEVGKDHMIKICVTSGQLESEAQLLSRCYDIVLFTVDSICLGLP